MTAPKGLLTSALLFLIVAFFFWPVAVGKIPFPGDLLVSSHAPWSAKSYLGYAPGGFLHKAQGSDVLRQLYPWKALAVDSFKAGRWPLWNPFSLAGSPLLANFQNAAFYPLNLPFFVLPFNAGWALYIILGPLLAVFFTYRYLRRLNIGEFSSLVGSLAFGFSLFMSVWLEWGVLGHTLLWLPLALLAVENLLGRRQNRWWLVLIFSLTSSLLAGYLQIALYVWGVVFLYAVFMGFTKPDRGKTGFLKKIVLVFGAALVLSSVQLWPAIDLFLKSARSAYPPGKISGLLMPFASLIGLVAPDFFGNPVTRNYWPVGTYIERVCYVGLIPLFFIVQALLKRKKDKRVLFWSVVAAAVLLFCLDSPIGKFPYLINLPILATTVPTRAMGVFAFAAAVLAGFGADYFIKTGPRKRDRRPFLVLGGVLLVVWSGVVVLPYLWPQIDWVANLGVARRNLILPTGLFGSLVGLVLATDYIFKKGGRLKSLTTRHYRVAVSCLLTLLIIGDLYFYFQKINPFVPAELVYPPTAVVSWLKENAGKDRFWGYGSARVDANLAVQLRLYSPDGYDPLFFARYGELISSGETGLIQAPIPRADVNLPSGYGTASLRENHFRQRLLNLLGVKYILSKTDKPDTDPCPDHLTFPEEKYSLVWHKAPWQIYENREALPRVFLAGEYLVETDSQKIIDLLLADDFPMDKKLILEEEPPGKYHFTGSAVSRAEILEYFSDFVKIKTESESDRLLFLSDSYDSGWRVKVDGRPTKLYRADFAFRAVAVPAGVHVAEFRYRPDSFRFGLVASLVMAGIIAGVFTLTKRKSQNEN